MKKIYVGSYRLFVNKIAYFMNNSSSISKYNYSTEVDEHKKVYQKPYLNFGNDFISSGFVSAIYNFFIKKN